MLILTTDTPHPPDIHAAIEQFFRDRWWEFAQSLNPLLARKGLGLVPESIDQMPTDVHIRVVDGDVTPHGYAAETQPPDSITFAWGWIDKKHRTPRHEFGHLWHWMFRAQLPGDWGQFGHGTTADILVILVQDILAFHYQSNPGDMVQVRLQHKQGSDWITIQ